MKGCATVYPEAGDWVTVRDGVTVSPSPSDWLRVSPSPSDWVIVEISTSGWLIICDYKLNTLTSGFDSPSTLTSSEGERAAIKTFF